MILDYSEFITNEETLSNDGGKCISSIVNSDLFYSERGRCPHCNLISKNVFQSQYDKTYQYGEGPSGSIHIWECARCGWWEIKENNNFQFPDAAQGTETVIHSILKSFEEDSADVPISSLRNEIRSNGDLLNKINPYRMEKLVQSIFSEFYNCEVEHCGQTNDGGIDLIVVNKDEPLLVQVKRRINPRKSEGVSQVRELLGSTLLKGEKSCAFVTTADSFSKQSQNESKKALTLGLVNKYELFNKTRLLEMLGLISKNKEEHWRKHLETWDSTHNA